MLCLLLISGFALAFGQQVKITSEPLPVTTAQHLPQIFWTTSGSSVAMERIYCISDMTSQLRLVCVDCHKKNITDLDQVLSTAQDVTQSTGFPALLLTNIPINDKWAGVTIICQARAFCRLTVDSAASVININGHGAITRGQRRR